MRNLWIHVACNDPDNGLFDYRADQISVGSRSDFLELAARRHSPRFLETDKGFRLAGKTWAYSASREWVGNWCWNAYAMAPDDAADFLIWLHGRRLFSADMGDARLFNLWRLETPLTDHRSMLVRLLQKEAT